MLGFRSAPYLLAWTVNSSVTIGVSYAMARWKRAWYAWLSFWLIVAVSLANGLLKAATPWLDSPWSGASWVLALVIVWSWYWLVRIPRLQPAAAAVERREVHVFHHVIHHGQELPGWAAAEVTSDTAARKVITGTARAIEPARGAGGFLGAVRIPRQGRHHRRETIMTGEKFLRGSAWTLASGVAAIAAIVSYTISEISAAPTAAMSRRPGCCPCPWTCSSSSAS